MAEAIFLYSRVIQKTGLIKSINLNNVLLPALQRQFPLHSFSPGSPSLPCRGSCEGELGTLLFRLPLPPSVFGQTPLQCLSFLSN